MAKDDTLADTPFSERLGPRSLVGQDIGSWLARHELELSITKDPPCREPCKSAESSNVLRGSLVIKVTDLWPTCDEFEPSTAEDPPCSGAMHVKSVDSSNVLPLVWCGS
ncbi:hypothetical protein TNCV_4769451 [Trichonephila clavipes]|nr:hypothetical protein TNCV_4769451 [Trichonephila clavipes]